MNHRLIAIIKKEFIQMRRDRLTLAMMVMLPLVQLILFGYAINTDVKHLPMAVIDYSRTKESRRLIQYFTNSKYFDVKCYPSKYSEIANLIDRGKIKVGLIIDNNFSKDIKAKKPAKIQVIVDASDPIVASQTLANSAGIGNIMTLEILMKNLRPGTGYIPPNMPVDVRVRGWYNPDLVSAFYIVPGLIGVILTMTMMIITSMAIVRERETGTLEQLITTPIRGYELMIGKIVPYIFIGYIQVTIALTVGALIFRVPIKGSILLLYALSFIFISCYLGLGLLVSTVTKSQLQAMQVSFFIFLPTLLLSGFMFPREGMPLPAQILGYAIPLTYFLQILRGIILKGVGIKELWNYILPLTAIVILIITVSIKRFKKQLD